MFGVTFDLPFRHVGAILICFVTLHHTYKSTCYAVHILQFLLILQVQIVDLSFQNTDKYPLPQPFWWDHLDKERGAVLYNTYTFLEQHHLVTSPQVPYFNPSKLQFLFLGHYMQGNSEEHSWKQLKKSFTCGHQVFRFPCIMLFTACSTCRVEFIYTILFCTPQGFPVSSDSSLAQCVLYHVDNTVLSCKKGL